MSCSHLLLTVSVVFMLAGCELFDDQVKGMKKALPETVTISVSRTPLSALFYIADEKGFFNNEGVGTVLKECIGGHRCISDMLNGDSDMSTASDLPIMFNSFKRNDFAVAATFVGSQNDVKLITRNDTGIYSGSDLRGKKVGIIEGASSRFFLDIFLLNSEVDTSEVKRVNLQPEEMPEALKNGEVDAISVWEPFGFETFKLLGESMLVLPHLNFYEETFNLLVMKDFAKASPEAVRRVLHALNRAVAFAGMQRTKAQDILAERLGKDREFIEWIWPGFMFQLSLDQSLIITLEDEARWAIKNGLVTQSNIPNYLEFIYVDALKHVNPETITIIYED